MDLFAHDLCYRAKMDLNGVQLFVAVAEAGSFSGAARTLRVSPSHVSRRIAALEEALDCRLFQRTTRSMVLTPEGRAYQQRVTPLLDELARVSERVGEDDTPRGHLRVASPLAFTHEHLAGWMGELYERYPELELELVLGYRFNDLVEDRIDVAIRLGVLEPSSLIATKLADMARVVVASPDYVETHGRPRRPKDLAAPPHRAVVFPYDGHGGTWLFRDGKRRETRVDVQVVARVPDGLTLRKLVLHSMGVSLLPRWLVASELREGTLVDLFPKHYVTSTRHEGAIWLVYPSRDHLPLRVRAFIDFVKERFAKGPPWS